MKINYTQLSIKAHYFSLMAHLGASYPYLPVYGKQLGVSPFILGIIYMVLPIVNLISKLILGFIIDYCQWRKLIFIVLIIVTSSSFMIIFFLPSLPGPMLLDHHFQNISFASLSRCDMGYHASAIASCDGTKDTACRWMCNNMNFSTGLSFYPDQQKAMISPDTACLLNIDETSVCQRNVTNNCNCNVTCDDFEDQCIYTSITFWGFVWLWSLGEMACCVVISTSDAICFQLLGEDKRLKYGKQRMWGTMGFGVAACLSGYMINLWSQGKIHKTYTPMLIIVLIFVCMDLISCIKLQIPFGKGSKTILKDVFILLKSKSIVIVLCFVVFSGIFHGVHRNFLFWYLEDLAVATGYVDKVKLIEGLTIAAKCFSEIMFFYLSDKILKKLGYGYTFVLYFACFALQLGLISLVPIWWILPIELITQGSSYALSLTTMTAYMNIITPPGSSATVQGLFQGLYAGVGTSIGGLTGGISYKKFGGTVTLRIFSVFAVFCALTFLVLYILFLKHKIPDSRNNVEWKEPDDAQKHCEVAET